MSKRPFAWPDGKRIAVAVTVMLETWSEGKAPPYGVQATPAQARHDRSRRHRLGQLWRQGRRVAHHRAAQVATASAAPSASTRAAPSSIPEAVAQIVKSGHDVAGHGYLQDQLLAYMTPEEEQRTIRNVSTCSKACPAAAAGLAQPGARLYRAHARFPRRGGAHLARRCARHRPAATSIETSTARSSHIPTSDFTDNRVLRVEPARPVGRLQGDVRLSLSSTSRRRFLALSMHCHFGGRPMISAIFEKIFKYMAQFPGRLVRLLWRDRALGVRDPARRRHPCAPPGQGNRTVIARPGQRFSETIMMRSRTGAAAWHP